MVASFDLRGLYIGRAERLNGRGGRGRLDLDWNWVGGGEFVVAGRLDML